MADASRLDELELAEIDIFDPAYHRDPHAVYDAARNVHPWLAKYQFGYLLLDYASMRAFLRDDERCRTPNRDITIMWNAEGTPFQRFTDHNMVALSGDDHKRIRDLVAPAFTPRAANKHRPFMREVFNEVLDGLGDAESCDINTVASQYPITVMCVLLGIARSDTAKFVRWLDVMEAAFGQDARVLPRLNESIEGMLGYVQTLIDERRKPGDHPDDVLQNLVDLAHEGQSLSDEELRNLLIILLGAGFDTTKNQLNLIMRIFIERPDVWQRVAENSDAAKPVIEESLRYMNPIGSLHRVTNVDITYRDVLIPANSFLSMPIIYNGRDPEMHAEPGVFNPDRKAMSHITFGQGIHICLGQFLARALLEEAVPIMARRMRNPRTTAEGTFRTPLGIWGYSSLPIAFERGPKAA